MIVISRFCYGSLPLRIAADRSSCFCRSTYIRRPFTIRTWLEVLICPSSGTTSARPYDAPTIVHTIVDFVIVHHDFSSDSLGDKLISGRIFLPIYLSFFNIADIYNSYRHRPCLQKLFEIFNLWGMSSYRCLSNV